MWKKKGGKSREEANLEVIRENLMNMPEEEIKLLKEQLSAGDDMKIERVTPKEWSLTHPMSLACSSDLFYADIANKLIEAFRPTIFMTVNAAKIKRETALVFTAYLEDFVCETRVWDTLRQMYKSTYGSYLPFFNTSHDDYFTDDINIEDLKFLAWQTFCRCGQQTGIVYSPYSDGVTRMAQAAYDLFVEVVEEAPQNSRVKNHITNTFKKGEYFDIRFLALWLSSDCKLTAAPWIREQIKQDTEVLLNSNAARENAYEITYYCQVAYSWLDYVSMMGIPTNILLSRLASQFGFEKEAALLNGVEHISLSTYEIVSRTKEVMTIKDESGSLYDVNMKSFGRGAKNDNKYVTTAITKYGDLWQQDGIAIFTPSDESFGKGKKYTYKLPEEMRKRLQEVVDKHDGRRVFYCKDIEEIGKIIYWMTPQPMSEDDRPESDNFLLMISDYRTPLIIPGICPLFDDRDNPFFKKDVDAEWLDAESMRFFTRACVPDDVAQYIQDNHLLPYAEIYASQGKRVGRKLVQDNLRFLFGFFRVLPTKFD